MALAGGLLQGGPAASLVLWLAINVLITASFRFVTLIGELNSRSPVSWARRLYGRWPRSSSNGRSCHPGGQRRVRRPGEPGVRIHHPARQQVLHADQLAFTEVIRMITPRPRPWRQFRR